MNRQKKNKNIKGMKCVILAGGLGTRISEESHLKPKPLIEIGGKPILWHIMKGYSAHGIHDFIICAGYKGYLIKEYFSNYFLHMSDATFDLANNKVEVHENFAEPWKVTVVDTGEKTQTAGRLKRIARYLDDNPFCFTYGDGVGDIDVTQTISSHQKNGKLVTVTAVRPPGRYGSLVVEGERVKSFSEKPQGDGGWISGGFFVVDPACLNELPGDKSSWESDILPCLAEKKEVGAHFHEGFWQPMDTLREKKTLDDLWQSGKAPWKIW